MKRITGKRQRVSDESAPSTPILDQIIEAHRARCPICRAWAEMEDELNEEAMEMIYRLMTLFGEEKA